MRPAFASWKLAVVMGLAAAPAALASDVFQEIVPCRLVDTRTGPQAGILASGAERAVTVTGAGGGCSIPPQAKAVALNVVAVGPSQDGFLKLYPANVSAPPTSTLNVTKGTPALANGALIALAFASNQAVEPSLKVQFGSVVAGSTHVVIDVTGYFVDNVVSAFAIFGGNGSDGTPNLSGGGTLFGSQYDSLTVPAGQTVSTGSPLRKIGVRGTCTIAGTLTVPTAAPAAFGTNGLDGTGQAVNIGQGYGSGAPTSTNLQVPIRFCRGGSGGHGAPDSVGVGANAVYTSGGGARSTGAVEGFTLADGWNGFVLPLLASCTGGGGGAGTQGACAGSGGAAGNGGGGGGLLYLECGTLDFKAGAAIHADGGSGANGTLGCGGGGGGGGGVVIIRARTILANSGNITVDPGAPGTGGGSPAAAPGSAGAAPLVLLVP